MKTKWNKLVLAGTLLGACMLTTTSGFSQTKKLPDGTIIYSDGTRKLPNGTIIYKGGNIGNNGGSVSSPDGSVVLPDGTRKYPNTGIRNRNSRKGLPPGQAKKMYGGKAKDYAPGQQNKWRKHKGRKEHDDNEHENGHGENNHHED